MPGRDGSGPLGKGPMSGRGMGQCNPNSAKQGIFGNGRGMGLGCRRGSNKGFHRMGFGINNKLLSYQYKEKD